MKTLPQLIESYKTKLTDFQSEIIRCECGELQGETLVDSQINISWKIRYSDTNKAIDLTNKALTISTELKYQRGILYSRLLLAVCKFINNDNNELLLREVLDISSGFIEYSSEWGFFICKIHLANIYELLGEYDNGTEALKELMFQIQSNSLRDVESELLIVSGNLFYRKNETDKAIEQYNRALKIKDELNDIYRYASVLDLLGRACVMKKELDKAFSCYGDALAIREAVNDPAIVSTYTGLAAYYKRMNDREKVKEFYQKAFSSIRKKDKFSRMICLYGEGHFYLEAKEYPEAVKDFEEALSIAKSSNIKNKMGDIYKSLSTAYEKTGSLDKALNCYKEYFVHKSKYDKEIFKFRENYDNLYNRNKDLLANIVEAKIIQDALLPSRTFIKTLLPDHLLFFKPLSIISGDYFWISDKDDKIIIILADCTGHGVKASLLSILGISFLDEIISGTKEINASEILNTLRTRIVKTLNKFRPDDPLRYGMDMAICIIDKPKMTLKVQYACAKRPILVFSEGLILDTEHDRMPVAYHETMQEFKYTEQELKKGDVVYLFSDGYPDQLGGEKSGTFKTQNFKNFLMEIHKKPFEEQEILLENKLTEWTNFPDPDTGLSHEQTDDISIFGFRV
jgi:tetratricopeptide (TPR) repeat protein